MNMDLSIAVSSKSNRIQETDGSLGIFNKISPSAWKRLFEYLKTMNIEDLVGIDCREIDFEIE